MQFQYGVRGVARGARSSVELRLLFLARGGGAGLAASAEARSQASRSMVLRSSTRRLRPISGPLTSGGTQACGRKAASDIFVSTLAAEGQPAFLRQAARGQQDFLLRGLDLAQPHRPLGLEVVLQHL